MDWTGLGLTLVFSFLAYAVKDIPLSLSWGGIALGLALITWKHLPVDPKYNGVLALVGAAFVLLVAAGAWVMSLNREPVGPDVTIKFVHPASPALVLVNNSGVVAKEIKWTVVIWNLDNPRAYSPHQPDYPAEVHEPFQIPVSSFDFLLANSSSGPLNLFGSALVAPFVKPGDRLVGSASAICPECPKAHSYLLSFVYGEGGWFSELKQFTKGELTTPIPLTRTNVANSFNLLIAGVPEKDRVPIGD